MTENNRRMVRGCEIESDRCARSYGSAPCTAALGTTGEEKCFNTFATCQDPANYALDIPMTLRFIEPSGANPKELLAIPAIRSMQHSSARLRPSKDLGERAQVTIVLDDFKYNDLYTDHYAIERRTGAARNDGIGYNPEERSTYFAKWRERNPYFFGRALRTFQGTVEQALVDPVNLSQMEVRHYIQESTSGPTSGGQFTIIAKDVLKLADDERAQAPVANTGELSGNISSSATNATITGDASQYSASGFLVIGREVFSFTRSGSSLTFSSRGTHFGTAATAHSSGDVIQECLYVNAQKPSQIVFTLLDTYAGINPAIMNLSGWNTESDNHIGKLYTRLVTKPTPVRELVSDLSEQAGFYIWTDESGPAIKFRAIRQPSSSPLLITPEGHIKEGTFNVAEQPKKRRSQVWLFFNTIDATDKETEDRNYASRIVTTDADSESAFAYGRPAIHKIYGSWLPANGKTIAEAVADRIIARYVDPPRRIVFEMPWNDDEVQIGEVYDIESDLMPDSTGLRTARRILVLGRERSEDSLLIESEEFNYVPPASATTNFIDFDVDQANVNLRSEHDAIYGAADGTTPVVATIAENVKIYSNSTGAFAFDVGSWPVGQPITIIIEAGAYITGAGGAGGNGVSGQENGSAGGPAFYSRKAVTVQNSGTIQGGGGGGAGDIDSSSPPLVLQYGGGGGAGRVSGAAGSPGNPSAGTLTAGGAGAGTAGNGGNPATAGQGSSRGSGGAAGGAVDGVSYITYSPKGTVTGSEIN